MNTIKDYHFNTPPKVSKVHNVPDAPIKKKIYEISPSKNISNNPEILNAPKKPTKISFTRLVD
jgi:hypothetical protein